MYEKGEGEREGGKRGRAWKETTMFNTFMQVMLAASYWSLLAPAIEMAEESRIYGAFVFVPVSVGFAAGAVFVYLADILLPILVSLHTANLEIFVVKYFHSQ